MNMHYRVTVWFITRNLLCAALQRKDWKEVEKQQNKLGLEQFLARRGIGSRKPVAIVRPILKSSK